MIKTQQILLFVVNAGILVGDEQKLSKFALLCVL